ncbi:orotidine-5'-phosphate decarboxylase [Cryobacterium tepidiphilum]|uniref:Orotidine 5'-phosphate decarboxylase n=1 Tax=Cryobacterium tepidiphilum TaxID=2486026 RepID=A0A3M8LPY9_9MICO|nr:orotidine-5'-phosphate decarboxylase [Cryobacterium tepidiphilum]RNE66548.1 orotidine-5'-phosphate decarboxylase [Cryobacterium tepidiphilum]
MSFGARLEQAFAERGPLCVGIDPHAWLLGEWNLPDSAAGAERFGRLVVEATAGRAGIVKPQVAFFERFGAAGYTALERVLADARQAGLLVIADAKRGDVGTSADGYGQAWLAPGSPLEADAVTASPYLGVGSLGPVLRLAEESGKGVFVLAATSNPEAALLQRALLQDGPAAGKTVARAVLDEVAEHNARAGGAGFGSVGVVLGATVDLAAYGIDVHAAPAHPLAPVLAPGFGYQGADVENLRSIYGSLAPAVIVSESRSVLSAGPERLADAIANRATQAGAARVH